MAEPVYKSVPGLDPYSGSLDGSETMVMVKAGKTYRRLLANLFGTGWIASLLGAFDAFKAPDAVHADDADTVGGEDNNALHNAALLTGTANLANIPAELTGKNAATATLAAAATKLQNARTIGGVSFDGTASINLPGVNTTGNQNTSGKAAAAGVADSCSGNAATATTAASCSGNAATASVAASCSGNAATASVAASCSGNAESASVASYTRFNANPYYEFSNGLDANITLDSIPSVGVTIRERIKHNNAGSIDRFFGVKFPAGGTYSYFYTAGGSSTASSGTASGGATLFTVSVPVYGHIVRDISYTRLS